MWGGKAECERWVITLGGEKNVRRGRGSVYHGIWSYASLLEYTSRMAPEIELALRSRHEESKRWKNRGWRRGLVFARAAGGETKGRGNIRSRHNRFHLLRRHRPGPDKNATPTKPFHRNLTSLSARSWRFSSRKELPYGHHSGSTERPYVWLGRSTVPPTRFPLLECFLN